MDTWSAESGSVQEARERIPNDEIRATLGRTSYAKPKIWAFILWAQGDPVEL